MQQKIGSFRLDFAGKTVIDEKGFAPGKDILVPAVASGRAFREARADGTYTAVRVRPDWSKIDAPAESPRPPRRVIAVVDTSRSSLEERALELDSLRMLLEELRPEDRFVTIASDIDARAESAAFVLPSAESIARSIEFVQSIDADGASNLAAAIEMSAKFAELARAAKDSASIEVIYIGDGTATWGETDPAALEKLTKQALVDAPFYGVVLGKSADSDLVHQLSAATGGRTFRPRTPLQARRFALVLSHAAEVRRLSHVRLESKPEDQLFPAGESTIYEGDDLVSVIRTPAGQTPPDSIKLTGTYAGRPFTEVVPIAAKGATHYVAQRWATQEIAALDKELEPKKDAIVKLSLDFGVMSQYTSFLVLESEEAYAKYDIERKQRKDAKSSSDGADPHVTGADLESVNGRSASLSPDRLQPGDPEIHIPAPADAKSVVVVFPFGETKVATFEHGSEGGQGSWMVRFLIDRDTPDGTYEVTVRITHEDDSIELSKLNYVVDTKKPTMAVTMKPARNQPGTYEIHATQVITLAEITSAIPNPHGTLDEMQKRYAQILTDAKRVEVRLPEGEILPLTAIRLGEFRGFWKPQSPLAGPVTLHVVAVDRALNQSAFDVVTP